MRVNLCVLLVLLLHQANGYAQASHAVPPREREILMELYAATQGDNWTDRSGWGTTRPVCFWHGVSCDYVDGDENKPVVAALFLSSNNLRGTLPATLGELQFLTTLAVDWNYLVGEVPPHLLEMWDQHRFEFTGARNAFTSFVTKAVVTKSSFSVCSDTADDNFNVVFDEKNSRAKWESLRCSEKNSRTYCVVREGTFDSLGRFSRALSQVNFRSFAATYEQQFSMTLHVPYLTTTAYWSDGSQHSVKTEGREGPREVWMAQQLFLGLLTDTYWDREYRTAACDFTKQRSTP